MKRRTVKDLCNDLVARSAANRAEIQRLERDVARISRQVPWLAQWAHAAASNEWEHPEGHHISAHVVAMDGTGWPFIEMWYKTHPHERSQRNNDADQTLAAASHP